MLEGNPNGPNHLKLLQVGLQSKCTTVQTIQIVQIAFVVSRILTVLFRETLTNSFTTYHASVLQYYAVIFSLREKLRFLAYEVLFYAPVDVK